MRALWILGGGGHAKSVIDAARSAGDFDIIGVLDDRFFPNGERDVTGVPIRGVISNESLDQHHVDNAVIAIGDNARRLQIHDMLDRQVSWATIVHDQAYVAEGCTIGAGSVVLAGAIVQNGATIGEHVILNTSCCVAEDCVVEDFAHIAPCVHLAPGTRVGEGAFVGLGTIAYPGTIVGTWSTCGAGAVLKDDVPENATAVGNPATVIKIRDRGWERP